MGWVDPAANYYRITHIFSAAGIWQFNIDNPNNIPSAIVEFKTTSQIAMSLSHIELGGFYYISIMLMATISGSTSGQT